MIAYEITGLERGKMSSEALCELLLFGNPRFRNIANKLILEATISFICLLEGWSERIELLAAHNLFYSFLSLVYLTNIFK